MKKDVYCESKFAFHRQKLEEISRGELTAPIYVRVKPTNKCNHRCFYCGYDEDKRRNGMDRRDEIPREKMLEILEDFRDMGVRAVTYSGGGEPLIYPHITEMLTRTLEYGIELSMITNGQELRGENAKLLARGEWVRISSDASDAETFSKTRGVSRQKFIELGENIRSFSRIKKPGCELGVNFVVHEKNFPTIYRSAMYFKQLGVNHIKFTPVWVPNFLDYHKKFRDSAEKQISLAREHLQDEEFSVYDTYEKDFAHCGIYERKYGKCAMIYAVSVIGADQNVYFCHDKAYSPQGIIGSIRDKSFRELWNSEETRRLFQRFNASLECRHHCANDTKNLGALRIIEDLDNIRRYIPSSERHKNFI